MNTKNPFLASPQYEEDEAVDAMEMAPSETSQDHQHFENQGFGQMSQPNPHPMAQAPMMHQQQQHQNQIIIFPPRQYQPSPQASNQTSSRNNYMPQQQHQTSSNHGLIQQKDRDQSQSLLNLSDSMVASGLNPNSNISPDPSQQNNQPSALVRQLSEKVRNQAERLQRLESYKQLCEKRIQDLDNKHPLPVMPQHLGQKQFQGSQSNELNSSNSGGSTAEVKRQLAIKEQDLMYAKQRNEKLQQENESLKKQMATQGSKQDLNQQNDSEAKEALRKEIQINEQLQKQIEILNKGNIVERMQQLEKEKNALLDYIEENLDKSQPNSQRSQGVSFGQDNDKLKSLEYEKSKLFQMCENLKYQEALSRQKILDLEEQLQNKPDSSQPLKAELQDLQQRFNQKCEDYHSLLKQLDPTFQENTFGNVEDLVHQRIVDMGTLQRELDFSKEQFESTTVALKREKDSLKNRIDNLDQRNMELEDKIKKIEKEKEELWQRAKDQYDGESERVDSLLYENDNLKKELDRVLLRLKQTQDNSATLAQTLNETQQELENLVGEHERLSEERQRMQELMEQYEREREKQNGLERDKDSESDRQRNEITQLRKEAQKQREEIQQYKTQVSQLNEQIYKHDIENRDLRLRVQNLQVDLDREQTQAQDRIDKQQRNWEQTIGDLTKELEYVQGELNDKEHIFQRVESELRSKLTHIDHFNSENTDLNRRVQDLQSDLNHMQTLKNEKEEKLRLQIARNEALLQDLERLQEGIERVNSEKEATMEVKKEKERQIEYTDRQMKKIASISQKINKQARQMLRGAVEFNKEFRVKGQAFKEQDYQEKNQQENIEGWLMDTEQIMQTVGQWMGQIPQIHKQAVGQIADLSSQLNLTQQKLSQLEQKMQMYSQEEVDIKERMRYLETENEQLREKIRIKDEEKRDQYQREEKTQRHFQQIKLQLESTRKDQEKLLMQIKSLLVEKERLVEEQRHRGEIQDQELERIKAMEVKMSQVYQQKQEVMGFIERLRESMPNETLRTIFTEIVETIYESFRLEEDSNNCETNLLTMENELRSFAKKEAGPQSLLSTKLLSIRKDVESQRIQLRQIQEQRDIINKRRESLEQELKCAEITEKRRSDVAIETEKSLTEVKFENAQLRKEVQFCNNNRRDLEIALAANLEEKKMIERELLSIRAQLQMKANQSKQSTIMQVQGQTLPPLYNGASLRHGELLFGNGNVGSNIQTKQFDSLISQKEMPLQQVQRQNQAQVLYTEQKQALTDRFSSAEKNQRVLFTGGMNSARGTSRVGGEDLENIEPNRLQNIDNQSQSNHYKSFQSLDQPLQQQAYQPNQQPYINIQSNQSRAPLGGKIPTHNHNSSVNSFKRPLSNRSGSLQGRPHDYEDSLEGGDYDQAEYPIRNSLKQRLNQVKNVFSELRKNLEENNTEQPSMANEQENYQ